MTNTDPKHSLEKTLVSALLADRRSDRRWRLLRTLIWAFLLILYAILIFAPSSVKHVSDKSDKAYVSLIRLNGVIKAGNSFSANKVLPTLIRAFRDKQSKGVVIVINSPGGSPVQASIIHDKILQLKQKYKKKVVVVGTDALASGAYLVATAADKIYVNKDTLTGSIGVIMSSFGFTDAIQKLGITRRVFTAGTNKDRLDPFKPITAEDKAKIKTVLTAVHQDFINDVLIGRKGKLRGNEKELFSGDFWTGTQATQLGLVDGTANTWTVLKQQFNVTHYKNYTPRPSILRELFSGVATQLHLGLTNQTPALKEVFQ